MRIIYNKRRAVERAYIIVVVMATGEEIRLLVYARTEGDAKTKTMERLKRRGVWACPVRWLRTRLRTPYWPRFGTRGGWALASAIKDVDAR